MSVVLVPSDAELLELVEDMAARALSIRQRRLIADISDWMRDHPGRELPPAKREHLLGITRAAGLVSPALPKANPLGDVTLVEPSDRYSARGTFGTSIGEAIAAKHRGRTA